MMPANTFTIAAILEQNKLLHSAAAAIQTSGHRPEQGQFFACLRCQHGREHGRICMHPIAISISGQEGCACAEMRSRAGACGDASLHILAPAANHHPAQSLLAL